MPTDRTVRVFISSPGDVELERRRAAAVVRRLDREFRRFFSVQPYLWEQEAQRSSGHFQDYIQPPSEFDVVVLILWSRLGTRLPEHTLVREYRGIDGRVPVTGTEWEYEEARARAERDGAPALLVFRNQSDAPVSSTNATAREAKQAQLEALDKFWRRHFEDRGVFLTAFTRYNVPEEFENSLEGQLRKVLRELSKKEATPDTVTISWFDRPFRGLAVYEFEHAPIFYGRDAVIGAATEQLVAAAARGAAFLLLRGASGSGKSSLVRAGLVPELYVPRAVSGIGAWRRVLFQPRDNPDDLFLGIARRIAETGPGIGLREMLSVDFTVEKLASHLRENPTAPAAPFEQTLGRLAREMQDRGELLDGERVRLILVVDQLEELFTLPSISGEQRDGFVKLLAGLAHSGVVWVVVTIRSDFWHRVAELPELRELASGERQLDLWPPNAAELTEIIRRPATAAGLQFSEDEHRVSLDSRLADDAAAAPGVLPLLSYTLEMLYERDVEAGHGRTLTWESYRDLGLLKGAIARRAEQAVASLAPRGVDEKVIARVLRKLVTLGHAEGARPVARFARIAEFGEGTPDRLLVDEFLSPATRLFVAEGDVEGARVRVAHEALLTEWERAKRLVAVEGVQLARRHRLEAAERDWHTARDEDKPSLLLPRGLPLNEAEALQAAWGNELDSSLRTYIAASREAVDEAERRRIDEQRRQLEERAAASRRIAIASSAAAIGFLILSVVGVYLWRQESEQAAIALARQLAAQASLATTESANLRDRSVLLAIESLRRSPSFEGAQALRSALKGLAKPRARFANSGEIKALTFSPNGQLLATGGDDKIVHVFSIEQNREVTQLAHDQPITSIEFSPNSEQIATAAGPLARLFDLNDNREVARISLKDNVSTLAFSQDGTLLAVGGNDKSVHVVEVRTGHEIAGFSEDKPVIHVVVSATGRNLAIVSKAADKPGETLRIIEIGTGHDLIPPISDVDRFSASGDGKVIAFWSDAHTTRVLDLESGQEILTFGYGGAMDSVALSRDGAWLMLGYHSGGLSLFKIAKGGEQPLLNWRVRPGVLGVYFLGPHNLWVATTYEDRTTEVLDLLTMHNSAILLHTFVSGLSFTPDGQAAVVVNEGTTFVLDLKVGPTIIASDNEISAAQFEPNARYLAAFQKWLADRIEIFNAESGRRLGDPIEEKSKVHSISFSRNGKLAVIGLSDEPAQIIDVESRREVARLGPKAAVPAVAFSRDDRYVALGEYENTGSKAGLAGGAWIFDTSNWKETWHLSSSEICTIALSNDGKYAALGEGNSAFCDLMLNAPFSSGLTQELGTSHVRVMDIASNKQTDDIAHGGSTLALAFSPDGRYLLIGSMDNSAILYDLGKHSEHWRSEQQGWVTRVAFSSDGRFAATTGRDGTTRVFNVADGREVARINQLSIDILFSPDNRFLLTLATTDRSNIDELSKISLVDSDLLEQACATVTQNLTREEWGRYLPGQPYRATCPNLPPGN